MTPFLLQKSERELCVNFMPPFCPQASVWPHCVCQLRVAHRNQKQQMINELYTINAWNRLAEWAVQMLQSGMHVYVKGYLTQRTQQNATVTEVTASYFVPVEK